MSVGHKLRHVPGYVASGQDAGVDSGMQGLDPAVQHLREAGDVGDLLNGDAGVGDGVVGAAGLISSYLRW